MSSGHNSSNGNEARCQLVISFEIQSKFERKYFLMGYYSCIVTVTVKRVQDCSVSPSIYANSKKKFLSFGIVFARLKVLVEGENVVCFKLCDYYRRKTREGAWWNYPGKEQSR